jgi:hypothetical protein
LSKDAVQRVVYGHTGWRQIGGEWVYLHARGAITARGLDTGVAVELDGPLSRFAFPSVPTDTERVDAVRASLGLLKLTPRVMAVVLGAAYRSVLGPADCSVHLVGHTGQGKSELSALGQQHFGAEMNRLNLPGSWLSTGNALETATNLAKDALVTIDDFKPGGSKADIDRLHAQADRVLRAQGNGSGRGRCRQDGSMRTPRPPRGLILSTGEDIPRGESLQARLITVRIAKGEIKLTDLTPYQREAARGVYAAAMAAYIAWLAARYEQVRSALDGRRAKFRDRAMSAAAGHARTPGVVADLMVAWQQFLDFAVDAEAITGTERQAIESDVWKALLTAAADHEREMASQNPVGRFLRLLASVITAGRGHLCSRDGSEPRNPEAWGWRDERTGSDATTKSWRPQGRLVGWLSDDDLYLDPEGSYAEAQRLGEDQGERLGVSKQQLQRHMKEKGLLVSHEHEKTTNRRTLQGRDRSVLHLHISALVSETPGEPGEQVECPHTNGANGQKMHPSSADRPGDQGDEARGIDLPGAASRHPAGTSDGAGVDDWGPYR